MTMDIVTRGVDDEHCIKPQAVTPALDTSSWPLLLKNYDRREFDAPWRYLCVSSAVPVTASRAWTCLCGC